jgi:antitoxin component of MazEF toxin-antitoxin module
VSNKLIDGGPGCRYYNGYNMEVIRIGKIIKIGNSLAVVLPKNVAQELKFERGDLVTYAVYGENSIVIKKVTTEEIKQMKPEDSILM